MTRRALHLLPALLVSALLLTGCAAPAAAPAPTPAATTVPDAPTGFVRTHGREFVVDGKPFRFVGINLYDAAATDRYSCDEGLRLSDDQLRTDLRALHDEAGVTVLRFWAYQTYTQGATDWSGVDQVLAAARDAGMKVLPALEDGPGNCTTGPRAVPKSSYRGDTWYTTGYRVPYGTATLSYRDYAAKVVAHYKDDPTILGWSMLNEAETNARDSRMRSALVDFATDMAGVIHRADPNHLVTVGTQSNSAPGASGADFSDVYGVPGVDFSEVHDWGYYGDDAQPMPGALDGRVPEASALQCVPQNAPIACSFARGAALDKPLVVGEAGMDGTTAAERTLRAQRMRAKMDAAFAAGAAGYVVWHFSTGATDGYDVLLTDHDPLLAQMKQVAEGLE